MRAWWVVLLVAALLPGCTDDGDGSDMTEPEDEDEEPEAPDEPVAPPPVEERAPVPPPIQESGTVIVAAQADGFVTGASCEVDVQCIRVPFSIDRDLRISMTLNWTNANNDFDLLLWKEGRQVQQSAQGPPGDQEAIQRDLSPGDFEIVIVPFLVANDDWEMYAEFSD